MLRRVGLFAAVLPIAIGAWGCDGGTEIEDAGFFNRDSGVVHRDASTPYDAGTFGPMTIQIQTIIDGDTAALAAGAAAMTPDGKPVAGEHVRFLGINAPEIAHLPASPNPECYGDEAKADARDQLAGRPITLGFDLAPGCTPPIDPANAERCNLRDIYGRLLAYLILQDGTVAQEMLLARGDACSFRRYPHRDTAKYNQLESTAKSQGVGLWANCACSADGSAVNPK
ncbi:MAG: thermonuclease family protein [Myxococcota bacterium]